MNNFIRNLLLALVLVLLAAVTWLYFSKEKVAFIDLPYVFSNFDYSREVRKDLEKTMNARKAILDSMRAEIYILETKGSDPAAMQQKIAKYGNLREQFESDNSALTAKLDEQVYAQLNQYMLDYGKDKNYKMIFGTKGDGSIMFADTTLNISSEFLDYINSRYKGNK